MTLLEDLKKRLSVAVEDCGGIPMTGALAKARHKTLSTVETFMKENGLWDQVKNEQPGRFVVVSQGTTDASVITVLISDFLKDFLRENDAKEE